MIKLRGNRIAVEKLKKMDKKESFIVVPDVDAFLGTIRYVGVESSPDLKVGQKVYFGEQTQMLKIDGVDTFIMKDDNILAVVDDEVKNS